MKIAFLSFYSGHLNRGVETYLNQLATRLSPHHQVTVYQSGPKVTSKTFTTHVIPVKISRSSNDLPATHLTKRLFIDHSKRQEFIFFLKVLPYLLKNNYDIIYPLNSGWPIPILRLLTIITQDKLVLAGHSGPGWDDRWNLLFRPDLFICFTSAQLAWARRASLWPNQRLALLPHAVDTRIFSPWGPIRNLKLQRPIIINVAASTKEKRVEQGIRAVARLKQGSFIHLGQGPLDERINNLGYKLLGKSRFLHTLVPHQQISDYYRSADLFTFCPYDREAFGLVYLEALASNLPVVATNDPIRKEIIGKAGLYVTNPQDVDEYASVLKQALAKKWGSQPRRQAQKFSWDKITDQYLKLFNQLVSS